MKPRLSVLTLAVYDLERAVVFYRDGLGFPTTGIVGTEFEHGAVAFFELEGGLKLALWPRASIAADTGLPMEKPSATELTLGHNVASKEDVDTAMQRAERAGPRSSNRRKARSGEATRVTFRIPTATSGRSRTTRTFEGRPRASRNSARRIERALWSIKGHPACSLVARAP